VNRNNVQWVQLQTGSKTLETWAGRAPEGNWLLLNSTWNPTIGQGWLSGGVRVEDDLGKEDAVGNHQCYIFEVAAIEEPTVKEQETGGVSKLVLAPTVVMAAERAGAIAEAAKQIKGEYRNQRTRWIVRQFVGNTAG
jgi:hypothetical protein